MVFWWCGLFLFLLEGFILTFFVFFQRFFSLIYGYAWVLFTTVTIHWRTTFLSLKWFFEINWILPFDRTDAVMAIFFCWVENFLFGLQLIRFQFGCIFIAVGLSIVTFLYPIDQFGKPAWIVHLIFFLDTWKLTIIFLSDQLWVSGFGRYFGLWFLIFWVKLKSPFDLVYKIFFTLDDRTHWWP